jgi:PleD family two-component response regulator
VARPRVLVAGTTDAVEAVRDALRGDAEVVAAYSVKEALARVDEDGFGTVVCNVKFDESRMFEFLQALMERGSSVRIVAFRIGERALPESSRNAIRNALEALGVERFVDLIQIGDEYGDDVALETLRKMILDETFVPPAPPG